MKKLAAFSLVIGTWSLLCVSFLISGCASSSTNLPPPRTSEQKPQDKLLTAHRFDREVKKTVQTDYLLFLPKDYNDISTKRWPLILFLHGAGERGTNVWRTDIHGPTKYIAQHPEFPFILVSPLCPANEIWSDENVLALLDGLEARYKVDPTRVYLTGLSMGGFGTWSLGMKYPERFAAMAPICGGGQTIYPILAAKGYAPAKVAPLRSLAVWAFHGGKDTVVPSSETEHMLDALKQAGVEEVHFTLYPDKQHDSWTETYNNPELYDWFLKHQRKSTH